jgi:hypothetical protein
MNKSLILFMALSLILGCKEESMENYGTVERCNILQSIEELNELLDQCNENLILSTSEIEENLIGEWTLSGIISGWTAFEPTMECLLLSINNESLTLKDLNTSEEITSTWTIISYEVNNNLVFFLEPDNEELRWSVGMQFFSKNIMYGAGLADDTDTYIYKR